MSKNHSLCNWNKSDTQKKPVELAGLIENPEYFCLKCVRASSDKGHLCKPQKINKLKKK